MAHKMTSTLKLALLVSLMLHVALIVQFGGTQRSFHERELASPLNISFSGPAPTTKRTQPEQTVDKQGEIRVEKKPAASPRQNYETHNTQKQTIQTQTNPAAGTARQIIGDLSKGAIEIEREHYLAQLLRHVDRFKTYPYAARRNRLEGKVVMQIELDMTGRLKHVECLDGNDLLCQAATKTLQAAAPLPTPSPSLPALQFKYAMEYQLRH